MVETCRTKRADQARTALLGKACQMNGTNPQACCIGTRQ